MTDRELLELAAKAAGIPLAWSTDPDQSPRETIDWQSWNPLTSDGDAFRLAVKCNLRVIHHPALNQVLVRPYCCAEREQETAENVEGHPDPYAATRRAIVRAAAEIGRQHG